MKKGKGAFVAFSGIAVAAFLGWSAGSAFAQSESPIEISVGDQDVAAGDTVDAPDTEVGTMSDPVVVTIANVSDQDLTLPGDDPVTIENDSDTSFSVVSQPSADLASGDTEVFSIEFDPTDEGTHTATIVIATGDPDQPTFSFTISGSGVSGGG